MRAAWSLVLGLTVALLLVVGARADEKKEVTLKGTITCAKCDLKVEGQTKCHTVIKVKEGDKDVVYWFDDAGTKKYHSKICTTPTKGSAVGTVAEKDGKKIITVTKVDFE